MLKLEDLKGKNICVTGEFRFISRAKLTYAIEAKTGHKPVNHCSEKTDFIFVADSAIEYYNEYGKGSTKLAKAVMLKKLGYNIRFISEETVYDLFPDAGYHKQTWKSDKLNGGKEHDIGKVTFKYEH